MLPVPPWLFQFLFTVLASSITILIALRSNRQTQHAQEQLRLDTARREYVERLEQRVTRLEHENQLLRASDHRCQEQLAAANERIIALLSRAAGG